VCLCDTHRKRDLMEQLGIVFTRATARRPPAACAVLRCVSRRCERGFKVKTFLALATPRSAISATADNGSAGHESWVELVNKFGCVGCEMGYGMWLLTHYLLTETRDRGFTCNRHLLRQALCFSLYFCRSLVTPVFINNKEHSTCYILQRTTMHTVHDTMFELRKISFAIFKQIILLFSNVLNLLRLVKSAQTGNSFHKLTTLLLKKNFL